MFCDVVYKVPSEKQLSLLFDVEANEMRFAAKGLEGLMESL